MTTPEDEPSDDYIQEVRERLADVMGLPVEAITPTEGSNPHLVAAAQGASMQRALDTLTTTPEPGPADRYLHTLREQVSSMTGIPVEAITPGAIVCGNCGRERGISDDYEYNPLQLVTGRRLGWYSNDDGEFCGECLAAMMRGQTP